MQPTSLSLFYKGLQTDDQSRTLQIMQRFSYEQLEAEHNYIQWMFPLPEPSMFNLHAPLMTEVDLETFKTDPIIQENLKVSATSFMYFLHDTKHWRNIDNHNYLRITRMLKCLKSAGLETLAGILYLELASWKIPMSPYWKDALDA